MSFSYLKNIVWACLLMSMWTCIPCSLWDLSICTVPLSLRCFSSMIRFDIHSFSNSIPSPSRRSRSFSLLLTTLLIPMNVVLKSAQFSYLLRRLTRNFVLMLIFLVWLFSESLRILRLSCGQITLLTFAVWDC